MDDFFGRNLSAREVGEQLVIIVAHARADRILPTAAALESAAKVDDDERMSDLVQSSADLFS